MIFRNNITVLISKTINDKVEKFKQNLINETVSQTLLQVESVVQNKNLVPINDENLAVHNCVRCDGCGMKPIKGIRYKCTECHNFDYCEACEELNANSHKHAFLKIRTEDSKFAKNFGFGGHCGRRFREKERGMVRECIREGKNLFCGLKDICMTETKTEKIVDEVTILPVVEPKETKEPKDMIEKDDKLLFDLQVQELRAVFALDGISDDRIIAELKLQNGDLDKTLAAFFN